MQDPRESIPSIIGDTSPSHLLGTYSQHKPGPAFVALGGLHGNEPAGIYALERVLLKLNDQSIPIRGSFYALQGNIPGLKAGQRFLDQDLNRIWTRDTYRMIKTGEFSAQNAVEIEQMSSLLLQFESILRINQRPLYFLDLHTTSAPSLPFFIIGSSLRQKVFARQLPVPVVLGIEETLQGTLSNLANDLGFTGINFEAGEHDALSSVDRHEAAIWMELVYSGCLQARDVPFYNDMVHCLRDCAGHLPQALVKTFHYKIARDDYFVMDPGFINFQEIKKGQPLATSSLSGKITAPVDGLIFMPLYQSQGSDGFFIVRPVD